MGGFESHKEYNRLLKNSADRQFSFLQNFQETTQKNTKNLHDNVMELLLWTVRPPSPVGGRPRASTRRCARPRPCARLRPCTPPSPMRQPSPAGFRAPPHQHLQAPVRAHMRPPSRTSRRAPPRAPVCTCALHSVPVGGRPRASTRRCARPRPCASQRPRTHPRPPACARMCAGEGVCGSRPGSTPGIHYILVH